MKKSKAWGTGFLAFALGVGIASGFFALLELPYFAGSDLRRYCLSHDVEKVTIFMFCWGLADLAIKMLGYFWQRSALRYDWLPESTGGPVTIAKADALFEDWSLAPASIKRTWIGQRLGDILDFVRQRQSAEGLDERLRQMADTAADRSHSGFALVRIIAWMIPILGFLGTVVGITIAVANVSPNQLDSSLTEVTGGLAMAFDATAVALALAMALMFAYFLTERVETGILNTIEDRVQELLQHRFAHGTAAIDQSLEPIRLASNVIIKHTESLVDTQANVWASALQSMLERSSQLHDRQQQALAALFNELQEQRGHHAAMVVETTGQLANVEKQLAKTAGLLQQIVEQGSALAPLQQALAGNLEALRQTQGLDDAMNSLTAAIHLLTTRARPMVSERAA